MNTNETIMITMTTTDQSLVDTRVSSYGDSYVYLTESQEFIFRYYDETDCNDGYFMRLY